MQECILPSKAVILYGPAIIPWTTFANATKNYDRHAYFCRDCKDGVGLPNSARKALTCFSQSPTSRDSEFGVAPKTLKNGYYFSPKSVP